MFHDRTVMPDGGAGVAGGVATATAGVGLTVAAAGRGPAEAATGARGDMPTRAMRTAAACRGPRRRDMTDRVLLPAHLHGPSCPVLRRGRPWCRGRHATLRSWRTPVRIRSAYH